jgi:hypothetical protein
MTTYTDSTGAEKPERRKARIEYSRNVPPERLASAMLDLIEKAGDQGIVVKELARVFGYSEPAINTRLYAMEEQGEAHRQKHQIKKMLYYTWHFGPVSFAVAPAPAAAPAPEDEEPCAVPRQTTVRNYPDGVASRCDLLTAFFGPPRRASDFCVPAEPGAPSPIVDSAPAAAADVAPAAESDLTVSRSAA